MQNHTINTLISAHCLINSANFFFLKEIKKKEEEKKDLIWRRGGELVHIGFAGVARRWRQLGNIENDINAEITQSRNIDALYSGASQFPIVSGAVLGIAGGGDTGTVAVEDRITP